MESKTLALWRNSKKSLFVLSRRGRIYAGAEGSDQKPDRTGLDDEIRGQDPQGRSARCEHLQGPKAAIRCYRQWDKTLADPKGRVPDGDHSRDELEKTFDSAKKTLKDRESVLKTFIDTRAALDAKVKAVSDVISAKAQADAQAVADVQSQSALHLAIQVEATLTTVVVTASLQAVPVVATLPLVVIVAAIELEITVAEIRSGVGCLMVLPALVLALAPPLSLIGANIFTKVSRLSSR